MPSTATYTQQVLLPTLTEYEAHDRTRGAAAVGSLSSYWDHIVRAESFVKMEGAIRLDRPAVAGIADEIRAIWESDPSQPDWGYVKQFAGAVAAFVVELNGYRRIIRGSTQVSLKVGRPHWNVGKVFKRITR